LVDRALVGADHCDCDLASELLEMCWLTGRWSESDD